VRVKACPFFCRDTVTLCTPQQTPLIPSATRAVTFSPPGVGKRTPSVFTPRPALEPWKGGELQTPWHHSFCTAKTFLLPLQSAPTSTIFAPTLLSATLNTTLNNSSTPPQQTSNVGEVRPQQCLNSPKRRDLELRCAEALWRL